LIVDGTTLTGAQVVQTLQGQAAASSEVVAAKAAWQSSRPTTTVSRAGVAGSTTRSRPRLQVYSARAFSAPRGSSLPSKR
jgi:hypothetical protein